jgi:hypothetical protein
MPVDRSNTTSVRAASRTVAACGLFLVCLSLLTGCATQPTSTAPSSAPAITAPDERLPIERLQKGMPAERVTALLGAPSEIKPNSGQGITSEIWIYTRDISGPVRQVAAEMREIPYVDPITGIMRTIQEPVFKNQRTYSTETTELLMIDGHLTAWKQKRSAESTEYQ